MKPSQNLSYTKEKLFLKAFRSACSLKEEIRQKITQYRNRDWRFCGMKIRGAFLFLYFTSPKKSDAPQEDACGCLQF